MKLHVPNGQSKIEPSAEQQQEKEGVKGAVTAFA